MKNVTSLTFIVLLLGVCWAQVFVPGYQLTNIQKIDNGLKGTLQRIDGSKGPYGGDLDTLDLLVEYQTDERLRVKIGRSDRWEVPDVIVGENKPSPQPNYAFSYSTNPFGFAVQRLSDGAVLFNTTPSLTQNAFNGLIFEDQYLEINSILPEDPYIYGLGERVYPLRLPVKKTYTMWNRDAGTQEYYGLYGSHAVYYEMRGGLMHGVFLLNANGMDVTINPGSIRYQTMGGLFDFYFFMGSSPLDVVEQYTDLIGKPFLPPYWSLGYHQSRIGWSDGDWQTVNRTREIYTRLKETGFPVETMWNDLDYMYGAQSWVFDPDRFPQKQIRAFVDELHNDGARYVVIVDHNIKIDNTYFPYTTGMQNKVFIWNPEHTAYLPATLWADYVSYFPDFTNISTTYWWANNVKVMHEKVPIDGLWIDMNEPTITCNGQCGTLPPSARFDVSSAKEYSLHNPPWIPSTVANVNEGTFNMSALMNYGPLYYLHNMFGYFQARASHLAMEAVRGQRGFVLSRSTFPGSGRYAAHWLGDNWSTWHDLSASIPGVLSFSFFGIPMVGPDICGFLGNASSQLCTRWMQFGAFFPFCRNHNASPQGQEPYAFGPDYEKIMTNSMMMRYSLLPYYYTLFYTASRKGYSVARPLMFEFPTDTTTWTIDHQMMIGSGLLITPVYEENATSVVGYFPSARWFNYYDGSELASGAQTLNAPLDYLNIHLRGGYIIPTQQPSVTTVASRKNPFGLIVGLDENRSASGDLYLDDGETIVGFIGNAFTYMTFEATSNDQSVKIASNVVNAGYSGTNLSEIKVAGLSNKQVGSITVNGEPVTFTQQVNYLVIAVQKELAFASCVPKVFRAIACGFLLINRLLSAVGLIAFMFVELFNEQTGVTIVPNPEKKYSHAGSHGAHGSAME